MATILKKVLLIEEIGSIGPQVGVMDQTESILLDSVICSSERVFPLVGKIVAEKKLNSRSVTIILKWS